MASSTMTTRTSSLPNLLLLKGPIAIVVLPNVSQEIIFPRPDFPQTKLADQDLRHAMEGLYMALHLALLCCPDGNSRMDTERGRRAGGRASSERKAC